MCMAYTYKFILFVQSFPFSFFFTLLFSFFPDHLQLFWSLLIINFSTNYATDKFLTARNFFSVLFFLSLDIVFVANIN